jgi:hypothetical protein
MNYVLYLLSDQADYLKKLKPPSDAIAAQIEELEEAIAILKRHEATKVPHHPPELVRDHPHSSD